MNTTFYIFLKFSSRNIFVNVFKEYGTHRIPFIFRSLNRDPYEGGKSNQSLDNTKVFARILATWVKKAKPKHAELVILFKHFGMRFKRRGQTHYGTARQRKVFLEAFINEKLAITDLIDVTGNPFNGCTDKKARRKKKKHLTKDTTV